MEHEENPQSPSDETTNTNQHNPGTTAIRRRRGGGPKTPAGKAKSAQNSRQHGLLARNLFLPDQIDGDEHREFTRMLDVLTLQYQPVGVLEEVFVLEIATASIRQGRVLKFETETLSTPFPFHSNAVDRILRYQATIHKQLTQAVHELERLQRLRCGDTVPAPLVVDVNIDATANMVYPETAARCIISPSAQPELPTPLPTPDGEQMKDQKSASEEGSSIPIDGFYETNSSTADLSAASEAPPEPIDTLEGLRA
jgi:hypothetical protein